MKIAFVTEMGFEGKIASDHPNMRTEFAWMYALDADHFNIHDYQEIRNYDHIFIIFPKGEVYLNAVGAQLTTKVNPTTHLLGSNIVSTLKHANNMVHYVQEGPHWLYNDYEMVDQTNFYNMLVSCDSIFAHNEYDVKYYKGLIPNKPIHTIPTLLIEHNLTDIVPSKQNKSIIGGNFARWYGGFESYIVAQEFGTEVWGQTSHCTRVHEDQLVRHLPRVDWLDWMRQLSSFRYAVHLMPTVAAGTFSLNCAYFGIPCIGNINVDTQKYCHPLLSVDVADLDAARIKARQLATDNDYYEHCSRMAQENYRIYYDISLFKQKINSILSKSIKQ